MFTSIFIMEKYKSMILINKQTGILILIKLSNAQLINEVINKIFDTMERVHNTLRYEKG